jgi:hypothetical protein
MSSTLDNLKQTLLTLPALEREQLARYLLNSLEAGDVPTNDRWRSFLDGMGSVLEVFPPPDQFDSWRASSSISLEQWPVVVRKAITEMNQERSE